MDALVIQGPARLEGKVRVSGSKNAALPLLFGALLFDEEVLYENLPRLWDIETTLHLLSEMGVESHWDKDSGKARLLPKVKSVVAPYEWVRKMRAGVLALGPLIAKFGEARVSLPGGCAIGARPINYHLEAMKKMGVSVSVEEGYVKAQRIGKLKGVEIEFPEVTVTGTENLLFLAVMADGVTTLKNAAREPEVVTLGNFLKSCGAKITGLGTSVIQVEGGTLNSPKGPIQIPPDRIETGTWIAASAVTRCPITIENVDISEQSAVLNAFQCLGVGFDFGEDHKSIRVLPSDRYEPLDIETAPYPGFATDMQGQLMVNLCLAEGRSRLRETIFENRFMHVAELRRLGAKISARGNLAIIKGPIEFTGAPVMASDLRASASLVLAGIAAKGTTTIHRVYHLDRGYQRFDEKLQSLGAKIHRISEK